MTPSLSQRTSWTKAVIWAGLACAVESLVLVLLLRDGAEQLVVGGAAHVAAALFARRAAFERSGASRAELDLCTLVALGLPGVGVAFAWLLPNPAGAQQAVDAHEAFESRRGPAMRAQAGLSGIRGDDLRGRLNVESDGYVLRHGSTQRRTNLVRKLGDRGHPEDFDLLWKILDDPEEELRIQAFLRLREARGCHRASIEALSSEYTATGNDRVGLDLADARLEYAKCRVLDPALGCLELEAALELATNIDVGDGDACSVRARTIKLEATSRLGRLAEASAFAQDVEVGVDGDARSLEASLVAWAKLAFDAKEKGPIIEVAERLTAHDLPVPLWMQVVARKGSLGPGHGADRGAAQGEGVSR